MKSLLVADVFAGFRIVAGALEDHPELVSLGNVRRYIGNTIDACARAALESETRDDIRVQLTRFMVPTDVNKALPRNKIVFLLVPSVWSDARGNYYDRVFKVRSIQYSRGGRATLADVVSDTACDLVCPYVHVEARDARFI